MRIERPELLVLAAAAGLAALVPCAPAHAEGVYGTLQLQYQKSDVAQQTFQVGTDQFMSSRSRTELWLRTLDLHQQSYLAQDLMLESNVRMTDQSYLGTGNLSRTPMGSMRLLHPFFQLLASYQPASVRSSLASQAGLNPDSLTTRKVTTYQTEALLHGHFGVPRWPQLDLSYASRVHDGGGAMNERNASSSARANFDREHYSLYGGVTAQDISAATPGSVRSAQQVWTGGGSGRYALARNASLGFQYDLSDVTGRAGGVTRPSTLSQSASLTGDWRPVKKLSNSLSWLWRRTDYGTPLNPAQSDVEGSLLSRWTFTRSASVTGGGGLRTVQVQQPGGLTTPDLQKYATAVAAVEARVRRNWTMTGNASHTTNWDPGRGAYGAESFGGTTRAQLSRKLQFDGTVQVYMNGDTAAAAQRVSNAWMMRVQGNPLRTLMLALSLRDQRVGPRIFSATTITRGEIVDLMWRPAPPLQVVGSFATSRAVPATAGGATTQALTVRFEPSTRWQWYGSFSHSDQREIVSAAGQLSNRETASSRIQYQPSRRFTTSAGMTWTDPGQSQESRQLDVAMTWSFGR